MVDLPNVDYDSEFKKSFKKLDKSVKIKVNKQVLKIINRPTIGKPMKHSRKGTRELYISPFSLSYKYYPDKNLIVFLKVYHKDEQ